MTPLSPMTPLQRIKNLLLDLRSELEQIKALHLANEREAYAQGYEQGRRDVLRDLGVSGHE